MTKNTDDLVSIMDRMSDKYGSAADSDYILPTTKIGLPCAVLFSEDNNWYRAKILQAETNRCEIQFVDYGNKEWHRKEDVCLYSKE